MCREKRPVLLFAYVSERICQVAFSKNFKKRQLFEELEKCVRTFRASPILLFVYITLGQCRQPAGPDWLGSFLLHIFHSSSNRHFYGKSVDGFTQQYKQTGSEVSHYIWKSRAEPAWKLLSTFHYLFKFPDLKFISPHFHPK